MILVFKTTVDTAGMAEKLKPHLDEVLPHAKWNFDLGDCDRILRIDGPAHVSSKVIETLQQQGFDCVELD
ncbi:MAG: hypothetical protein V4450_09015 [Bacteroidota bacterium]